MKKYFLILFAFVLASCATKKSAEVEAVMFKEVPAARSNPHTQKYLQAIAGKYKNIDGTEFTVSGSGDFTLDNIDYSVHEVISAKHAIYQAKTPIDNSSRRMITYHGVITENARLFSAGLKDKLDYSKTPRISPEDTPYAAQLNGQRIENIDFDAGKATRFATRIE